jgi:hypothetical protein
VYRLVEQIGGALAAFRQRSAPAEIGEQQDRLGLKISGSCHEGSHRHLFTRSREQAMTRKTAKGGKPADKKAKRLSVSKRTLKDLTTRGSGPLGGVAPKPYPYTRCVTCTC